MDTTVSNFASVIALGSILAAIVLRSRRGNAHLIAAMLLTGPGIAGVMVAPVFLEEGTALIRVITAAVLIALLVAGLVCAILACGGVVQLGRITRRAVAVGVMLAAVAGMSLQWMQIYAGLESGARWQAAQSVEKPQFLYTSDKEPKSGPEDVSAKPANATAAVSPERPATNSAFGEALREIFSGKQKAKKPDPIVMQAENFRLEPPGYWEVLDARKVNPLACVVLTRWSERLTFIVIAEQVAPEYVPSLEAVATLATSHLNAVGTPKEIKREFFKHKGVEGIRIENQVGRGFANTQVIHQIMVHRGFIWQLMLNSQGGNPENVRNVATRLLDGFSVLNPERVASLGAGEREDPRFVSPFGWSIDLTKQEGISWDRKAAEVFNDLPGTEYAIMNAIGSACLAVQCVWLPESELSKEALADGFLGHFDIALEGPAIKARRDVTQGPASGLAVTFERSVGGGSVYEYKARLVKHGRRAWFACAWSSKADEAARSKLDSALDALVIDAAEPEAPKSLSDRQRRGASLLANSIALHYDRKGASNDALRWLVHANSDSNDVVIMKNLLAVAERVGRSDEALEVYEKHAARFRENRDVQAQVARIASRAGETEKALKLYDELFAAGHRNDEDLAEFAFTHVNAKDPEAGLRIFDKYIARKDAPVARRHRAALLSLGGKKDEAREMLLALRRDEPNEAVNVLRLVYLLDEAERYEEVVKHAGEYLAKHDPHAELLRYQASSQLALKRYDEAKRSCEAGLALVPTDYGFKEMLAQSSALLGEGDNSQIKTPIEAVQIPAEFSKVPDAKPGDYVAGFNAYFLLSVRAVSIETKDDARFVRTTEQRAVKVMDREGVERFNTLTFPFHPRGEDFYLNRLVVRDENGKQIAEGRVEDCYVLDRPDDGMATNERTVHIPVPGLRPGYTVEYVHTRLERLRTGEPPFIRVTLCHPLPALRSSFLLKAPEKTVSWESSTGLKSKTVEGFTVWTMDRPDPITFEPYMTPWHTFIPSVTVGDPKIAWTKLGKEYLDRIKDRLKPEKSLETIVAKATSGLKTDAEKVRALARYVQEELTYKAIEFGRRAQIPQTVEAITRNKYGDCKDHSLLLHQLLDCAKIASHLVLINSSGQFQSKLPSLDQFDHAILFVPGVNGGLFVDCTQKSVTCEEHGSAFAGYEALVLDPTKPAISKVPQSGAANLRIDRELDAKLEGDVGIRELISVSGEYAMHLRDSLRYRDAAERRLAIQSMLKRAEPSLEIREIEFENLLDIDKPLKMKIQASVRRKAQQVGDQFLVHVPAAWEHVYLDAAPVEKRRTPFHLRTAAAIESALTVRVPEGMRLVRSGELNRLQKLRHAEGERQGRTEKSAVQWQARVNLKAGQFTPAEYAPFVREMESLKELYSPDLSFERVP